MEKHRYSYRQQAKRQFNRFVFEALTNMEESETNLREWIDYQKQKQSKFLKDKTDQMKHAIDTAKWLIKECKGQNKIIASRYSPYAKEIQKALTAIHKQTNSKQTNLF